VAGHLAPIGRVVPIVRRDPDDQLLCHGFHVSTLNIQVTTTLSCYQSSVDGRVSSSNLRNARLCCSRHLAAFAARFDVSGDLFAEIARQEGLEIARVSKSMALCLAESLVDCRGFDPPDQMRRYVRYWREGCLSSQPAV